MTSIAILAIFSLNLAKLNANLVGKKIYSQEYLVNFLVKCSENLLF